MVFFKKRTADEMRISDWSSDVCSSDLFRIVGVLYEWRPTPRFYDMNSDRFGDLEQAFIPFSTSRDLSMGRNGSMNCWGGSGSDTEGQAGVNAPCVWIQYWVQLDTPAQAADYRSYLVNYYDQQRASGRYARPTNVRLRRVMDWLAFNQGQPGGGGLEVWPVVGFPLVGLLTT